MLTSTVSNDEATLGCFLMGGTISAPEMNVSRKELAQAGWQQPTHHQSCSM
jgi:hypothetical protein